MTRRQRDARGRFLPGHTLSIGNKGNQNPKFGNKNAVKHGLYIKQFFYAHCTGDVLTIGAYHKNISVDFYENEWTKLEDGFCLLGEKAQRTSKLLGLTFCKVCMPPNHQVPTFNEDLFEKSIKRQKPLRKKRFAAL